MGLTVRLACLIHAANVHSEPGSNPSIVVSKSPFNARASHSGLFFPRPTRGRLARFSLSFGFSSAQAALGKPPERAHRCSIGARAPKNSSGSHLHVSLLSDCQRSIIPNKRRPLFSPAGGEKRAPKPGDTYFRSFSTIIGSESLTSVFGMGTGGSFRISSPDTRSRRNLSRRSA